MPKDGMQEGVTRSLLNEFVEQPEPSHHGDWFVVDLEDLRTAGWRYVGFHFRGDAQTPDAAELHGEAS